MERPAHQQSWSILGQRCLPVLILLVAFMLVTGSAAAVQSPVTYTFGVVPQFDTRTLHKVWRPILDNLEKRTGLRFRLRGSATIPEFEQQFLSGLFDFVYMNPYHVLIAGQEQGYIPLIRDHGQALYGILVVKKVGTIHTPEALQDQPVAFPSPNALGASLQMRSELLDRFGVRVKPVYVNTHSSVYLNVVLGLVAAGGGVQKTLARQPDRVKEALQVLYRTDELPPHPVSVHPRVPAVDRNRVREAFQKMGDSESGKALLARVPIHQVGPATMRDYEPLGRLGLERFYVR